MTGRTSRGLASLLRPSDCGKADEADKLWLSGTFFHPNVVDSVMGNASKTKRGLKKTGGGLGRHDFGGHAWAD
jgi:hypothetical protein